LHGLEAMPPEQFDPRDHDGGAADHRVERLQGLLLAEPGDPLDQELQVGLDRPEIDVLGVTSRQEGVVIVCHGDVMLSGECADHVLLVVPRRRFKRRDY